MYRVVYVSLMGLMDTLSHAREFVLTGIPIAHYLASDDQDAWSGQDLQDMWDAHAVIAEPLSTEASTGSVALVLVALQRVALELGREWIAAGFGRDRIHELWDADTFDQPESYVFSWVSQR